MDEQINDIRDDRDAYKRQRDKLVKQVIHLRSTLSEMQIARDAKNRRISELQAKLARVEKLPEKWRGELVADKDIQDEYQRGEVGQLIDCIEELQQALEQDDE